MKKNRHAPADRIDEPIAQSHLILEDRIRERARQIYLARDPDHGSEIDDWLKAEREILGESGRDTAENRATAAGHAGRPGVVL